MKARLRPCSVTGAQPRKLAGVARRGRRAVSAASSAGSGTMEDSKVESSSAEAAFPSKARSLNANAFSSRDGDDDVPSFGAADSSHPLQVAAMAQYYARLAAERPLLRSSILQDLEHKLEADIASVFATLCMVVGFILIEYGVQTLLDHYLGDSVLGSISCIIGGLAIVFWIKLSGGYFMNFWQQDA